jgi:glutathione S-transferase
MKSNQTLIKLIGFFPSRASRILWALEEIGKERAPYEIIITDTRTTVGKCQSKEYGHPLGLAPILITKDSQPIFETLGILDYLAEEYSEAKLKPKDSALTQGRYWQWLSFITTEIEAPLWVALKHRSLLQKELRIIPIVEYSLKEAEAALAVMRAHLADKEFVLNEAFTTVDLVFASLLHLGEKLKLIKLDRILERYLKKILEREFAKKCLEFSS